MLSRIPARFIKTNPGKGQDYESQIADLARGLDENDAFVIFPEGGNFTPERRRRGIERLRGRGLDRMADRAARMTHVLAPRARAASWPRSTRPRTRTSCWSPTPGSTTCSPSATSGASSRWTR